MTDLRELRQGTIELRDGSRVTLRTGGHGPPMLAMPGGPGITAHYLTPFAEPLLDAFTWYLVDPPGTGGTDPMESYGIPDHVGFYREVVATLGLERTFVMGHSYSATVAPTFAIAHPDVTRGCLLVSSPVVGPDVDESEGGSIRKAMNAVMARHSDQPWYQEAVKAELDPDPDVPIEESFKRGLPLYFSDPRPENVGRLLAHVEEEFSLSIEPMMWFYEREWPSLDLRPLIGRLDTPVLAIAGAHDWAVPPIQAAHYREASHGEVVVIERCGHFVPIEAADTYTAAVRVWLESAPGA